MIYFLEMVRGDSLSFGVELEGLDQDLDFAYFTCKKSYDDENAVFQKSIGDGIYKLSQDHYGVRIAPDDTENVVPDEYYYDLKIGVNSDVFTILRGVLDIYPDATRLER